MYLVCTYVCGVCICVWGVDTCVEYVHVSSLWHMCVEYVYVCSVCICVWYVHVWHLCVVCVYVCGVCIRVYVHIHVHVQRLGEEICFPPLLRSALFPSVSVTKPGTRLAVNKPQ